MRNRSSGASQCRSTLLSNTTVRTIVCMGLLLNPLQLSNLERGAITVNMLWLLGKAIQVTSTPAAVGRREQHQRMARPAMAPAASLSTTTTSSLLEQAAEAPAHRASQPACMVR